MSQKLLVFVAMIVLIMPISYQQNGTFGYSCNVSNCQVCSFIDFCGLCQNNYILQVNSSTSIPYCQKVNCTVNNCQTCYQNNICQVCKIGYYPYQGSCMSGLPSICQYGCLSCNGSTCIQCRFGMYLYSGDCFPLRQYQYSNCLSSFTNVDCQLCVQGFIVSPLYRCVPNPGFTCNALNNCDQCNMQNLLLSCTVCDPKYSLNQRNCATKTCQVSNCRNCNGNKCVQCNPGYQLLNSTNCSLKIFQCNVSNCLYCKSANVCALCKKTYYPFNVIQNSTILGSNCYQFNNSVGSVIPVTNCQVFGPMIPGSSELEIGCTKCMPNFILSGGYCVANINIKNFLCNVKNCRYCVQNNVCGRCAKGYVLRQGTENVCNKIYSPLASCYLSSTSNTCGQCQSGYVQLFDGSCIKLPNQNLTCNVSGCSFCIKDDVCYQCLPGYNITVSGLCQAICSIANCYQCSSTNTGCQTCAAGYYLSQSGLCLTIYNQTTSFCNSTFGPNCSGCTYYNCTQCSSGSVLNTKTNTCCPAPAYNMAYCTQYVTTFSNQSCSLTVSCAACSPGTMLVQSIQSPVPIYICVSVPCSLPNCAYCFQSKICGACNLGYNLVNNTCVAYSVPSNCTVANCITCNNNGTCSKCLYGYLLYAGTCVCSFQNCLQCVGNTLCTQCAYPTKASSLYNAGCLPIFYEDTLCNVTNCQNCMNINFCAECSYGFTLQPNGSCTQNICNQGNNCSLCNLQQTICYSCKAGYMQNNLLSPVCVPIPTNYSCYINGCSFCQPNNPNVCQRCTQYNSLASNGTCQPLICVNNCVYCMVSNTCVLCQVGFYLTTSNTCQIDIGTTLAATCPSSYTNCISCQFQAENIICVLCVVGMQPSFDQKSCVPQDCAVPNCLICKQSSLQFNYIQMCLVCQQGYQINSYSFCSPADVSGNSTCQNIYNCIYCAYPNYCVSCANGWNPVNGSCITNQPLLCTVSNCLACTQSNICVSCASGFNITSNYSCAYNCNITNCLTCSSLTTCSLCVNNLQPLGSNTTCGCTGTFVLNDSSCVCPTVNTTGNNCILCEIANCQSCSSPNICAQCTGNLTLNNNTNSCNCPDNTFLIASGNCVCPQNSTYLTNQSTCIPCNVTNCIYCQSNNLCETCINNLLLLNNTCGCGIQESFVQKQCIPCFIQNCLSCSSPNFCNSCSSSDLLINGTGYCVCPTSTNFYNNSCVLCVDNCILCEQPNICIGCITNYYALSPSICILCNISNCATCSSSNYCTSCSDNLEVNSLRNLCVNCTVENCQICLNNQTCSICDPGFLIDETGSLCGTCDIVGCTLCFNISICQTCLSGYSLTDGLCVLCIYPCATCAQNTPSTCLSCQPPYSLLSNPNGVCYTCNIPNCVECLASNFSICSVCQTNYIVSQNNTCIYNVNETCSIDCAQCLLNQICQQCNSGFAISPTNNSQCIPCTASNCLTCSSTDVSTCLVCISGYYVTINGQCMGCPYTNCQTCTAVSCTTYLNSSGQMAIVYNNTIYPVVCDPGCLNCSSTNPLSCITCASGFSMNTTNMICVACIYPCLQCASNAPSLCLSCYSSFILTNGACLSCNPTSNCLTCESGNLFKCTSCPVGYYLKNGSCFTGCPNLCMACSSSSFCTICQSGYAANPQGQCIPCLSNCRTCSGNTLAVCLSCGQGFYLSPNNSSCLSCSLFCQTCNQQGCLQCMKGYTLTQNQTCALSCYSPCATCILNNPSACTSCLFGYNYNSVSNSCSPILECPGGLCFTCPIGSIMSSTEVGACTECTQSSNCARCTNTNLTQCLSCQNGFYINSVDSTCLACPPSCLTCTSPKNCQTCSLGYTIQIQASKSVPGVCVKCQPPCAQCVNSSSICTSCVNGYSLDGWNCQTNFNFEFNLLLNTSGPALFNNYNKFLLTLVGPFNTSNFQIISIDNMVINSGFRRMLSSNLLVQNNVVMSGKLSTTQQPNSDGAGNQFYGLQNIFNSGNVGGIQLLSYQLFSNGGSVPPPSSTGLSVGVIVAIAVGIPIILLIIAFGVWQIRHRRESRNRLQKNLQNTNKQIRQQFEMTTKAVPKPQALPQVNQLPDI